jgi:pimeloyl-ACP methyl ester carboxylesterase
MVQSFSRLIVLVIIGVCFSGCFGRFVMTKKEIRNYYKNKPVKPTFFTIKNDSISLFCAATGSDTLPPLILIHGAPGAWYGYRATMDDSILQKHFHIISVDRLGYDKSRYKGKRKPVNSFTLQATAIHEALRINKSRKTGVLLGSSYGAPIAAKMAIMYPGEFHYLVLLAPAIDPDREKFWWFHKYLQSGFLVELFPHFIKTATAEKFGHVEELRKLDSEWKNLTVPATVMQGGRDYIIDPQNFDYAKKVLEGKDVNFIYLPDAQHLIRLQYPDTVRSVLLKTQPAVRESGSVSYSRPQTR